MDSTLQDIIGALLCGGIGYGGWRVIRFITYKPPVTRSLDYLYRPEMRKRFDAELEAARIARENQPEPMIARVAQEARILVQDKILPKFVPEKPEPVPVEEPVQIGSEIDNLAFKDPKAYLELIMGCIEKLYTPDPDGIKPAHTLSRDKIVPKVLRQIDWDYLIGPETAGTKQPGILRELNMVHNHKLPESRQEVEHYFLLAYVGAYSKEVPAVEDAVKAIAPWIVQEWEELQKERK